MTRRDLLVAHQAVQAAHAALEFAVAFPALARQWHTRSGVLAVLAVTDEAALWQLEQVVAQSGCRSAAFLEPDLGSALTAIAVEPAGWRLVRRVPLAFPDEGR